ncbi:9882_t:CDS:2, partial [Cetraspora pellucida]
MIGWQKKLKNILQIKDAWNAIDPSLICHSFKYCGISNVRDGSEEHLIFDYDKVTEKNANNVGNYVYLSNKSIDTNENIETYFRNEKNEENRISVREYKDDYYEIEEINYINEW